MSKVPYGSGAPSSLNSTFIIASMQVHNVGIMTVDLELQAEQLKIMEWRCVPSNGRDPAMEKCPAFHQTQSSCKLVREETFSFWPVTTSASMCPGWTLPAWPKSPSDEHHRREKCMRMKSTIACAVLYTSASRAQAVKLPWERALKCT